MSKIVKPLDLTSMLGKQLRNRVVLLGVELEGGWKTPPVGCAIERDGSVFHDQPQRGYHVGELPLGPFQLASLNSAMKKHYPDLVDDTCGMHVHMSFETVFHYNQLMVPEYQETIIWYLQEWAKQEGFDQNHFIWGRLRGESEYCQKKFWPDLQANQGGKDYDKVRKGHRYTIVHYPHKRKGTIEVRVLPMMKTVDQAIRAVREVVNITNASLMMLAKYRDNRAVKEKLVMGDDVYEEFIRETV